MVFKQIREANALNTLLLVARYYGLYCNPEWSWPKRICYYCYSFAAWSFVSVPAYYEVSGAYYRFVEKDYKTVFQIIGVVSNAFAYNFVICGYYLRKKKFLDLINLMKVVTEKSFKYSPEITGRIYPAKDVLAKRFLIMSVLAYEALWVVWSSPPIVAFIIRLPNVNYSTLPLSYGTQNYGLDEKTPLSFWIIIVIQFIHGTATLSGICFGNTVTPFLCILVVGQIDILNQSLKRLDFSRKLTKNDERRISSYALSRQQDILENPQSTSARNRAEVLRVKTDQDEYFTQCVEHHQLILRILSAMKPVLAPSLCVVLMNCMISMTNFMILFAMFDCDALTITILALSFLMLGPILVFETWSLTVLKKKVAEVAASLYNSKWLELTQDSQRKQDYLIISQSSRHAVKFSMILFSNLDFHRLYQLFNLGRNYFSLMMNMEAKLKAEQN